MHSLFPLKVLQFLAIVYDDNLSVVLLAANPVIHKWTKYFELDLYFVRMYLRVTISQLDVKDITIKLVIVVMTDI